MAANQNGAAGTAAHLNPVGVWKSVILTAGLHIQVLHIKCYLCINATCVIMRHIKCELIIGALLYREFLIKLYHMAVSNKALNLIQKIFQGRLMNKELWLPRSPILTLAIFIYGVLEI